VRASGIGFREGYGLTECGPNCFATSDAMATRKPGTVGWPVPGLGMRLVDDEGRDVPPGETGELLLRGPQMFAGYLGNPEQTAEAMTPDGWLRTGDLARRDGDGAFTICGRRKEMFISGGENVFPGEVEAALAECDAVAEAVVVGVPDAKWGEVGCAFVVARPGAARDDAAASTLLAAARGRLAAYKVPRRVIWLDELPRLGSGKADRRALLECAAPMAQGGA
jgi:fatty-acyl-CoA synthase